MSKLTSALALSLVLSFSQILLVNAQVTSTVTCLSNTTFLYNSRQQSPCLMGAYLGSVCNNGSFTITPLDPDEHYSGPTSPTDCTCSTVTYSLVSACGICQAREITTWSSWSENCTRVFVRSYPSPIPSQITVPNWAYADVTLGNTFDPNVALTDTGAESGAPAPPSTTTSTTSTSSSTGPGAPGPTSPGGSDGSNNGSNNNNDNGGGGGSSTNVGAIAGGVVGGVVALAAIGVGVFLCLRRRKQQQADQGSGKSPVLGVGGMQENGNGNGAGGLGLGYNNAYAAGASGGAFVGAGGLSPNNTGVTPASPVYGDGTQYGVQQWPTTNTSPMTTGTPSSPNMNTNMGMPMPMPAQTQMQTQMKPYDPNDPTTFPTSTGSPVPSGGAYSNSGATSYGAGGVVYPAATGSSGQNMGMAGVGTGAQGYSYAPEIQDSRRG